MFVKSGLAASVAFAALLTWSTTTLASDATAVTVVFSDKGAEIGITEGHGIGSAGAAADASMSVAVTPAEVKAGEIAFEVINGSKDTVHEFVVARVDDPSMVLPYKDGDKEIDEDKMSNIGEIEDIDAGKSGKVNFSLKPGTYLLYCNIAGHYMSGMWSMLKVTE